MINGHFYSVKRQTIELAEGDNIDDWWKTVCEGNKFARWFKKVLVHPKQFSPSQLQSILDWRLNSGDKILVECELVKEVREDVEETYAPGASSFTSRLVSPAHTQIKCNKKSHAKFHEWFDIERFEKFKAKYENHRGEKLVPISLLREAFDAGIMWERIDRNRSGDKEENVNFDTWLKKRVK